jgi:predicted transcriptional regulator
MEARPKVLALLPRTVKELSDETGFSDGVVRTVLNKAIEKGTVEKHGHEYRRVPDTPVAAAAA